MCCTVGFQKKKLNTSRPSERPDGIIGCQDKRAPIVVTLGHQYHGGAFFCGTVHLLMTITKSSAVMPSVQLLATSTAIYASPCLTVEVLVVVRAGVTKLLEYPPDRQGYNWILSNGWKLSKVAITGSTRSLLAKNGR